MFLFLSSCGIFKTHHKDKLIAFENNKIPENTLKLNGYYFAELEFDYKNYSHPFIDEYIETTGISKIKYLSVFFFYEDGYVVHVNGIDGLSRFYCAEKETYDNTYESAHETIELMLQSQYAPDKRTKRICGFQPNDIGNKGLVKIENDKIKIQTYKIEPQSTPGAGNSAYLYELNGTITSDSTFVISSETKYRTDDINAENSLFKFRPTNTKPAVDNYFKMNVKRFN
ncbi:hypothetical protein [Psychroserpens sp.]|uniref:hypothetical protein n=1 Tax=Psychroserpens sp. TaxID=2020870 RepID=UPI001B1E2908|nr:hypothetical protein [Psychroserpens sp.]MBO6606695.1 hypothetical protein [Psychroserpens sp.]MBO6631414.1 hypothetical protein [Psychroserpens sp.]MBO6653399.1 hypothetical protein [Psychroserpens sp.]MBO6680574.1 hypothetical protein [Psychroserpens sp.]MBO6750468.1 hypothetical protein [Psychroserpens sp.]